MNIIDKNDETPHEYQIQKFFTSMVNAEDYQQRTVRYLQSRGLSRDHAMEVLGVLSDHREVMYQRGYRVGYKSGYEAATKGLK